MTSRPCGACTTTSSPAARSCSTTTSRGRPATGTAGERTPEQSFPHPWEEEGEPELEGDLELRTRLVALDPLEQTVTLEMRAAVWEYGRRAREEEHLLTMRLYFVRELELMLERAGFVDVELRAGYRDEPPTADDDFVVYVAHRS
jgi:hypothetical protein